MRFSELENELMVLALDKHGKHYDLLSQAVEAIRILREEYRYGCGKKCKDFLNCPFYVMPPGELGYCMLEDNDEV